MVVVWSHVPSGWIRLCTRNLESVGIYYERMKLFGSYRLVRKVFIQLSF